MSLCRFAGIAQQRFNADFFESCEGCTALDGLKADFVHIGLSPRHVDLCVNISRMPMVPQVLNANRPAELPINDAEGVLETLRLVAEMGCIELQTGIDVVINENTNVAE
jgi:hypothetical protein